MKKYSFIEQRPATSAEIKRGAEVAFDYLAQNGKIHTVLACVCYESWEQFGAPIELLSINVDRVDSWRQNIGYGN